VKKHGTEGIFNKQLLTGNIEERVEEILNSVFLSLNKDKVQKSGSRKRLIIRENKDQVKKAENSKRSLIEVSISGKQKTCLEDIWKVFYLDQKTKQTGYFLVNDYQREREFNDLEIGTTRNIYLIQGYKHQFLSRLC
jgi:hypothetical protein